MSRYLPLFALASLALAICLLGLSWLAEVLLDRPLGVGEWVLLGLVLIAITAVAVRRFRLRHRRRLQDMRDSALW